MDLTHRLQAIRLKAGFSEAELATAIGVSRTSIYKVESGANYPSVSNLLLWVEACGCGLDIYEADNDLQGRISALEPADRDLLAAIAAILPDLTPEQREMYGLIFRGLGDLLSK